MTSESRKSALIATKYLIENTIKSQVHVCIDEIYEKLCDIISNEMEGLISKVEYKNKNNRLKNSKPLLTLFNWIIENYKGNRK